MRVISVAGAKGSPGCSFIASALALCLGDSGIPTLLVDADAEGGGLAAQLDIRSPGRGTVDVAGRVRFMELGDGDARLVDRRALLDAAGGEGGAVIIDLGHQPGFLQRQLAAASEWLLWVVVPDRSGLERADRALASGAFSAASGGLVLNRIRRGSLADAGRVLSERHGMPVVARVKDNRRIGDRISRGRPAHRMRGTRQTLMQLARCVHPDAPPARPAWP